MGVAGGDSDSLGALVKRTFELTDDQVGELMDVAEEKRGTADSDRAHPDLMNYYELSLRILGAYIDSRRRTTSSSSSRRAPTSCGSSASTGTHGAGHQLSEFTREEMLAMIESAPEQRQPSPSRKARPERRAVPGETHSMKAIKVLLISIGAILAALIVIPLTILAGLFVWLKLTEETDDEEMELDDTI